MTTLALYLQQLRSRDEQEEPQPAAFVLTDEQVKAVDDTFDPDRSLEAA